MHFFLGSYITLLALKIQNIPNFFPNLLKVTTWLPTQKKTKTSQKKLRR